MRIASYPKVDTSLPFAWTATAAEAAGRVRAAMDGRLAPQPFGMKSANIGG
jgi:hypothetical protein